jgi:hypothetical protein
MSDDFPDVPDATLPGSGASIVLPNIKNWGVEKLYDYRSQIIDHESLEKLNASINAARLALFRVADELNKAERAERKAKVEYDREWRRAYLRTVGKTETIKKANADLQCEELENRYIEHEQMKNELSRLSFTLRTELQTLQTVGNNVRQQMKME